MLGPGLASINKRIINHVFDAKQLRIFNKADKEHTLGQYEMVNCLGLCKTCQELGSVARLSYTVNGFKQKDIIHQCDTCNGEYEIIEYATNVVCPKCGGTMEITGVGNWD